MEVYCRLVLFTTLIGGIVRITADIIGAAALLVGLWLIVLKILTR